MPKQMNSDQVNALKQIAGVFIVKCRQIVSSPTNIIKPYKHENPIGLRPLCNKSTSTAAVGIIVTEFQKYWTYENFTGTLNPPADDDVAYMPSIDPRTSSYINTIADNNSCRDFTLSLTGKHRTVVIRGKNSFEQGTHQKNVFEGFMIDIDYYADNACACIVT